LEQHEDEEIKNIEDAADQHQHQDHIWQ
jgi:hypothetical protein